MNKIYLVILSKDDAKDVVGDDACARAFFDKQKAEIYCNKLNIGNNKFAQFVIDETEVRKKIIGDKILVPGTKEMKTYWLEMALCMKDLGYSDPENNNPYRFR